MKHLGSWGFWLVVLSAAGLAGCSLSSAPDSGRAGGPPEGGASGTAPASITVLDGPVEVPESSDWNNPGVTKEQNRADLESCHGYAFGLIEHDIRIEDDRATLRDDDLGIGFADLNRSMNSFDFKNRREGLFEDCMESKGYRLN